MSQQSDLELMRQVTRNLLEDLNQQTKPNNWRYWIPPASVALLLFGCGAFCGVIITLALVR
ncbi:hypothetical protein N7563_22125 [Leclercia adecarboxylata ATCC 23216 = NBRC 102595]|nr:hypothetical protein [Leclercia adecarboxylata ATCC 23216 = NBRC 102595]